MKVLRAAEMREVDRRTIELGIGGPILMENAGHRVVEFLESKFAPLQKHRIVVICGKGNNGGDGFVIARQLHTRFRPASLHVVALFDEPGEPRTMLEAAGGPVRLCIEPEMQHATLVIDAITGTGLSGPARGPALDGIRAINNGFPHAKVVAVDMPSGMQSDTGENDGEVARADATVTFTAPKLCHVLPPNCDRLGELHVGHIGSPAHLMETFALHLTEPGDFAQLLAPRRRDTNKGTFGHVLTVGGAPGKTGAAEMAGLAALRAGAGLVTVACSAARLGTLELMTAPLPQSFAELTAACERKNVVAIGPGLGLAPEAIDVVRQAVEILELPLVIDADGLNALAGHQWKLQGKKTRILTPHPGEMARLAGMEIGDVQRDRIAVAQRFAAERNVIVALKGYRTAIALPDGRAWINPTGTPALATGGTGDILTGLLAGMLAQWPERPVESTLAAVYLHGLCGQLGAEAWGERSLLATDLLKYLPEAMHRCAPVPN
jgi:NAD(P)H-hydrate epimerase